MNPSRTYANNLAEALGLDSSTTSQPTSQALPPSIVLPRVPRQTVSDNCQEIDRLESVIAGHLDETQHEHALQQRAVKAAEAHQKRTEALAAEIEVCEKHINKFQDDIVLATSEIGDIKHLGRTLDQLRREGLANQDIVLSALNGLIASHYFEIGQNRHGLMALDGQLNDEAKMIRGILKTFLWDYSDIKLPYILADLRYHDGPRKAGTINHFDLLGRNAYQTHKLSENGYKEAAPIPFGTCYVEDKNGQKIVMPSKHILIDPDQALASMADDFQETEPSLSPKMYVGQAAIEACLGALYSSSIHPAKSDETRQASFETLQTTALELMNSGAMMAELPADHVQTSLENLADACANRIADNLKTDRRYYVTINPKSHRPYLTIRENVSRLSRQFTSSEIDTVSLVIGTFDELGGRGYSQLYLRQFNHQDLARSILGMVETRLRRDILITSRRIRGITDYLHSSLAG